MITFVIGDIQGGAKALKQCLERSNFNKENDRLIILGDVCDGWAETKQCVDILLNIKNKIFIRGNHDQWFIEWFRGNHPGNIWTQQGGYNTQRSYGFSITNIPHEHIQFFQKSVLWFEENGNLFVHGGIDPNQKDMRKQDPNLLLWDRDLVQSARFKHPRSPTYKYGGWDHIFLGHTTTEQFSDINEPLRFCNIWMLDTGGGWHGKLTIMNIDTNQYWQSDTVKTLYPDEKHGRV